MSDPHEFWMQLNLGFWTQDLETTATLLGKSLGLRLEARDDLELGGLWFGFEPDPVPETGINHVRLGINHLDRLGYRMPQRPEVPLIAEISLFGADLLDLGRLARRLEQTMVEKVTKVGYVIADRCPETIDNWDHSPLWRSHRVDFDPLYGRPLGKGVRGLGPAFVAPGVPHLRCQLSFGLGTCLLSEVAADIADLLEIRLTEECEKSLGGQTFRGSPPQSMAYGLIGALLRFNQMGLDTWLYPSRKEHRTVLDLDLATPSLLDLGYVATLLEERRNICEILACRIVGDLCRDRVLRVLRYGPKHFA